MDEALDNIREAIAVFVNELDWRFADQVSSFWQNEQTDPLYTGS